MISIIIPSKTERFLDNTIKDVLEKATGEIEVFAILDGYIVDKIEDPRLKYIVLPKSRAAQKRQGINSAVEQAKGEYIMALDAHCMMAKGFDEQLIKDHQPDWVQIPRRHRLDAENWCLQTQSDDRPPIDYETIMYPGKFKPHAFHGFKWNKRTLERWDIPLDETITMQASCWFMTKEWYQKNNFMQVEGFTGWGQEAESICFKTWLRGGKVMTNKNTWYAHLHKGKKYGRMYFMSRAENRRSYIYSFDYFMNNKDPYAIHTFKWLIQKFNPPGWPKDWEKRLNYKE